VLRPRLDVAATVLATPVSALGPVGIGPELVPFTSRILLGADGTAWPRPPAGQGAMLGMPRLAGEKGPTAGVVVGILGVDGAVTNSLLTVEDCGEEVGMD
jgi:hypothetical protein